MSSVGSPCFGGWFHYVGANDRLPTPRLDPYVLVSARQWVIAVSFSRRVQKREEEAEAAGSHYPFGKTGRAGI